ncbi:MAG: hypothetical protein LC798_21360 [Chloroflexi bacterium]|nr:hypothetical protein [Chloroflexota bacterium]
MRRLVSIPIAVLMSLLVVSTALASFCGSESKPDGKGQHATLLVVFSPDPAAPPTVTILEGANAAGKVTGGFVDVILAFPDGSQCVINDTYFISEHRGLGEVAPGQELFELAVLPAVHQGRNPGGDGAGAGFAELIGAGC